MARMTINGFGQLEINNCAFRRDGRVEAQCALSTADFSESVPCENGMILAVDKLNKTVKFAAASETLPVAIVYSAEHTYEVGKQGLKDFKAVPGDIYPRLGYLSRGDLFTTNCVCYSASDYATESALESALDSVGTTAIYGTFSSEGAIAIAPTTLPTNGCALRVVKKTTMPDGQIAIQFQVL